jgi:hypothetical protein
MNTRKNYKLLTATERSAFVAALIKLKNLEIQRLDEIMIAAPHYCR